ncbi:MAG TPA: HAD family hydrolase [Candidatus Limnocylindrales bacterium]|nr:HAD family hydrolase [Candidatus Limnocylindrales bacterium]
MSEDRVSGGRLAVAAITFDFGNTLVRVDRVGSRRVILSTAEVLRRAGVIRDEAAFLAVWAEERDRQFREEVPQFREVDVPQRAVRVLARLRGMDAPLADERWDDAAAAEHAAAHEAELVVETYSRAFVERIAPVPDATTMLERLAGRGFRLAVLSNWPLARTIDRFAELQGWLPFLQAIVVSQRVGTIKPHPLIFRAAEAALGMEDHPGAILHVGDDWAADVVGAKAAGWRAAYVRGRQADTPLPTSEPGDAMLDGAAVAADLEIDELSELDGHVELAAHLATHLAPAGPEPLGTEAATPA